MELPPYEVTVDIVIGPEATIAVNGAAASPSDLTATIDALAPGRSKRLLVVVIAPASTQARAALLPFVKTAQQALRRCESIVFTHYRTQQL